ncbi:lipopolysaccharide biosynthesis protein [Neorhizobium sp. NCHU2750]|uniref:lipopolysaccharide biosynthesis protein n=1 Tax=Neorhizobium sp. NCHU2750 TaxID=1825976 RepID=UPI000E762FA2|nr:multi antimicrobial extrusion protein MatE [Neorhizobium sp. NCHU2750]
MAVIETAGKLLPPGLRARFAPLIASVTDKAGTLMTDRSDVARAQRQALTAFVIRIASAAIAFLSQIVLARIMGEFEYGLYAFVWVIVILTGNLSCLGFHTSIIRFYHQHVAAGDAAAARGLNVAACLVALVVASVVGALGFAFLGVFGESLAAYYILPVGIALFIIPMIALGDILDGLARSRDWPVSALAPTFIARPILILAFMAIAALSGAPRDATTAMGAALAATYLTTLAHLLQLVLRLRKTAEKGPRRYLLAPWLKYSLPLFLVDGIGFLLTNADVVVVGLYLPPDQVGVYFAAAKTIVLVQFVYFSIKAAAAPRFSAIVAKKDIPALAAFAAQATRWTFWPSLAVGLTALAAGELLLSLFGPAFTDGYWLMAILFAGILTKSSIGPAEILLSIAGHQNLCVAVYAVTLSAAIALYVILIPLFGVTGAAIAASGAIMIETLLLHIAVRRRLGITLFAFARQSPAVSAGY